ncbi:formylglycine-generating enzyme family protein [Planctomycetota bacterium]
MINYTRRDILSASALALLAGCANSPQSRQSTQVPAAAKPPHAPVLIKGGSFRMGSDSRGDHQPAHHVELSDFYMDRYEVTNGEYHGFCQATERKLPEFWGMERYRSGLAYPQHPVIGISWSDAAAYSQWSGKRLPTEAEWEYAARGGLVGKKFPHGDVLSPEHGNYTQSQKDGPVEVGTYAPNGFGLFDMQGNVLEWVHDRYSDSYYEQSPTQNPMGPSKGRFRVIRGGGWHSNATCNQVFWRNALPANWVDFNVGFRCAKDMVS